MYVCVWRGELLHGGRHIKSKAIHTGRWAAGGDGRPALKGGLAWIHQSLPIRGGKPSVVTEASWQFSKRTAAAARLFLPKDSPATAVLPANQTPTVVFSQVCFCASQNSLNAFSLFLARCFIAALRTRYTAAFLCCSQSNIAAISFFLLSELYFGTEPQR